MAAPRGGPPVARGGSLHQPTPKHRPGSRGKKVSRERDPERVAEIEAEAQEEWNSRVLQTAREHKGVSGALVERVADQRDTDKGIVRYWVRRMDWGLAQEFGGEITLTFEVINARSKQSTALAESYIMSRATEVDTKLIEEINSERKRQGGFPLLKPGPDRWDGPLVPIVDDANATIIAMQARDLGLISNEHMKKLFELTPTEAPFLDLVKPRQQGKTALTAALTTEVFKGLTDAAAQGDADALAVLVGLAKSEAGTYSRGRHAVNHFPPDAEIKVFGELKFSNEKAPGIISAIDTQPEPLRRKEEKDRERAAMLDQLRPSTGQLWSSITNIS